MPLIQLEVKNVWGAFALSAFVSSVVVVMAIYIKDSYDSYTVKEEKKKEKNNSVDHTTSMKGVIITFIITFMAYMISYTMLYFLFGYKK